MIKKNEIEPSAFGSAEGSSGKQLLVRKISDLEDQGEDEGGAEGEIEFTYQDPSSGQSRDDLPVNEQKRLLKELQNTHEGLVKKQKLTREQRAAAKAGYSIGLNAGQDFMRGKEHFLNRTVQFGSGVDKKVNPNHLEAETNHDKQLELRRSFDRQHQPENKPKSTPTPKPQPR